MTKGFVFTLDNAFATIIAAIFLVTISFLSSYTEDPYPELILQKQAGDALAVLDKSGELSTLNSTVMTESLGQMLPSSLSWGMEIDYYNYSLGFNREGNLSFGNSYSDAGRVMISQREFVVFEGRAVKYYGIARLRLWTK